MDELDTVDELSLQVKEKNNNWLRTHTLSDQSGMMKTVGKPWIDQIFQVFYTIVQS